MVEVARTRSGRAVAHRTRARHRGTRVRGGGIVTRPRTRRVQVIVQSRARRSAVAAEQLLVPGESPRTRLRRRSAMHVRGRWAGNARPRAHPRTLQPFRRRGAHATCGRRPLAPPTVRPLRSVPSRHLARRHSAGPSLVPSDVPFNEARAGTPQRRPLPVVDLGVPSHLGQVDDILRHRDRVLPRRTRRRVEPAGPSGQEPSRPRASIRVQTVTLQMALVSRFLDTFENARKCSS